MDLFENANNKKDPNKISGTNIDNLPLFLRQYRIMQDMPKYDILSTWISK